MVNVFITKNEDGPPEKIWVTEGLVPHPEAQSTVGVQFEGGVRTSFTVRSSHLDELLPKLLDDKGALTNEQVLAREEEVKTKELLQQLVKNMDDLSKLSIDGVSPEPKRLPFQDVPERVLKGYALRMWKSLLENKSVFLEFDHLHHDGHLERLVTRCHNLTLLCPSAPTEPEYRKFGAALTQIMLGEIGLRGRLSDIVELPLACGEYMLLAVAFPMVDMSEEKLNEKIGVPISQKEGHVGVGWSATKLKCSGPLYLGPERFAQLMENARDPS